MKTVNIHYAKTHLSRLVEEAVAGDDVVIAKAGMPLVRLVRVAASDTPRKLGKLAGRIVEADDCWAPDPEIDALFYGAPVEPKRARRVAEPKPKPKPKRKR